MEQRKELVIVVLLCVRVSNFSTIDIRIYIACLLQEVLKDLSQALSTGCLYCDIYKKVSHAITID